MKEFEIIALRLDDPKKVQELLDFCDEQIGRGYYSREDLYQVEKKSQFQGKNCSLLAYSREKNILVGIRFTLAPGQWIANNPGLTLGRWPVDPEKVAYFKSLFIHPDYQQFGLGSTLSLKSIEIIKKMSGLGVVCHSTLGSPNNSSMRYLQKLGFIPIQEHPLFWNKIDYECTHCLKRPCICSAVEMFKKI